MDLELSGKVALITGGSRGLGLYTAQRLLEEGCQVGICGRNPDDLETAANELRRKGGRVVAVRADVTDPVDAVEFVARCIQELGGIDILVNNAGGFLGQSLMEATDEDWQDVFEWNVFQVIRMIRLVVPHMEKRGGGAIVNLGSSSGWHVKLRVTTHYSASKATIIYLTERLAADLLPYGVRVNTVSPGSTIWPGGGWDQERQRRPDWFEAYVQDAFPMGRLGRPEEVADVIAFLVSPRSQWVNGRHIPVDGLEQSSLLTK